MRWILIAGLLAGCATEKVVTIDLGEIDCVSVDERAKQIKIGMTEFQVINIVGRPDGIYTYTHGTADEVKDYVRFIYVQPCPSVHLSVHFVVLFCNNSVVRFGPSEGVRSNTGKNDDWL